MTNTNSKRIYHIEIVTCVDHPELRGPGYAYQPEVGECLRIRNRGSYNRIISEYNEIMRGGQDFGSEYVCSVEVWSTFEDLSWPKTVRKTVTRKRVEGTRAVARVA